jgi:predicted secreted protein
MTITAAFVLFAVLWFLALLTILPLRVRTQGEDGAVVPGTPSSAPTDADIRRKLAWATVPFRPRSIFSNHHPFHSRSS